MTPALGSVIDWLWRRFSFLRDLCLLLFLARSSLLWRVWRRGYDNAFYTSVPRLPLDCSCSHSCSRQPAAQLTCRYGCHPRSCVRGCQCSSAVLNIFKYEVGRCVTSEYSVKIPGKLGFCRVQMGAALSQQTEWKSEVLANVCPFRVSWYSKKEVV